MDRFRSRAASLAVVPLLACAACGAARAQVFATQQSVRNGVHVAVTPASLDPQAREWEFAVAFHSDGPALRDDVLHAVSLVADGIRFAPLTWQGTATTATHHRVGIVGFAAVAPLPQVIEVRLQREGEDGARVFRWETGGWYALGPVR